VALDLEAGRAALCSLPDLKILSASVAEPYGSYYRQYVFSNSESAVNHGYKDGFKTGKDDGKKAKSFNPQRSHYYHDAGFGNFAEVYRSGFSRGYQDGYRVGDNERAG
jgi:flagellar biosynthesis/type III secretory pathway protein FliH